MAKKEIPKKFPANIVLGAKSRWRSLMERRKDFLDRRPHRSLQRTRRRDLPVHAPLPGYFSFTKNVFTTIRAHKKFFALLLVVYCLFSVLLIGVASQESYQTLTDSFKTIGSDILGGDIDSTTQTIALFGAAVTGGLTSSLTEVQQAYMLLLGIIMWLSIVWYLRQSGGGVKATVRDALYNSGAPLVPMFLVVLVIAVQLIPGALGILLYTAADSAGILNGGVEAMMFAVAALLLATLSLYWVVSSFFATIIITIPGTYPFAALKMAGDIVIGRRFKILLRLVWLAVLIFLLWAIILIPVILLNNAINIEWLPFVPFTVQILGGVSILFGSAYVYLFYRRVIDGPAS